MLFTIWCVSVRFFLSSRLLLKCAFKWSSKINSSISTNYLMVRMRRHIEWRYKFVDFALVFPCPHPRRRTLHTMPQCIIHPANSTARHNKGVALASLRTHDFYRTTHGPFGFPTDAKKGYPDVCMRMRESMFVYVIVCVHTPTFCGLFALCTLNPHNINTHTHTWTRVHTIPVRNPRNVKWSSDGLCSQRRCATHNERAVEFFFSDCMKKIPTCTYITYSTHILRYNIIRNDEWAIEQVIVLRILDIFLLLRFSGNCVGVVDNRTLCECLPILCVCMTAGKLLEWLCTYAPTRTTRHDTTRRSGKQPRETSSTDLHEFNVTPGSKEQIKW